MPKTTGQKVYMLHTNDENFLVVAPHYAGAVYALACKEDHPKDDEIESVDCIGTIDTTFDEKEEKD